MVGAAGHLIEGTGCRSGVQESQPDPLLFQGNEPSVLLLFGHERRIDGYLLVAKEFFGHHILVFRRMDLDRFFPARNGRKQEQQADEE